MRAVNYAVRGTDGDVIRETLDQGNPASLKTTNSQQISLNLNPGEVQGYVQKGGDLHVLLANGEVIVLENFFAGPGDKELFLSKEGYFTEVLLTSDANGTLTAQYSGVEVGDKWSSYDDLVFLDIERIEPVVAPLVAPALGGLGFGGAAAAAAGVAAAGVAFSSGGDDGVPVVPTDPTDPPDPTDPTPPTGPNPPTNPTGPADPTVNDADVPRIIGGTADSSVTITGTGEPGTNVEVVVGTTTETTTIGPDGTWEVVLDPSELPADGVYDSVVNFTGGDGSTETLDGPRVDIDTTPPDIDVTSGTQSTGDLVNSADHQSGTVITGTGEAGAAVSVVVGGATQSTTVAQDGTWSVTFGSGEIAEGEYNADMTIVSTDARGNSTTITDVLVVDTVAPLADVAAVTGDDLINAAEASGGVTLTGTGEPGASISVEFQGVTQQGTVDQNGAWSFDFASVAAGTYTSTINVSSTDAAGNTFTTSHDVQVDTENGVTLATPISGDNILNQAEAASDLTLTGTTDPGSSVQVTLAGVTRTATVDANGNWSAVFAAGSVPGGEYDAVVNVLSTDAAGNTATASSNLRVDTVAGDVALSTQPIEVDDVINAVERQDGVEISGTATPGLTVTVGLGAASQNVLADANGNWSTTFAASDIPRGTQTLPITASITDAAGNSRSVSDTVELDTVVDNHAISTAAIEGDDVINAAERADGVTINGTTEPGSTVEVQFGNVTRTADVDASGNWTVDFAASDIPEGTYATGISATATDPAGNVSTTSSQVQVDTEVDNFGVVLNQAGDDIVNASERANGVTLNGTTEPGSTVNVTLQGSTRPASVDSNGNWSVTFPPSDLPEGTYEATATIVATDAAGNSSTLTDTFQIDTEIDTPNVDSVTFVNGDVGRISTDNITDNFEIGSLAGDGTTGEPEHRQSVDPVFGTEFTFTSPVPDGTHLVVRKSDAAGNASATLVVLEDNATNATTIENPGLSEYDIQGLNLEYAADTNLTLDETQILELSGTSDVLQVQGGADDTLTLAGATKQPQTQDIDGQTYDVYTVGDSGAVVVVDQEVNVII